MTTTTIRRDQRLIGTKVVLCATLAPEGVHATIVDIGDYSIRVVLDEVTPASDSSTPIFAAGCDLTIPWSQVICVQHLSET